MSRQHRIPKSTNKFFVYFEYLPKKNRFLYCISDILHNQMIIYYFFFVLALLFMLPHSSEPMTKNSVYRIEYYLIVL